MQELKRLISLKEFKRKVSNCENFILETNKDYTTYVSHIHMSCSDIVCFLDFPNSIAFISDSGDALFRLQSIEEIYINDTEDNKLSFVIKCSINKNYNEYSWYDLTCDKKSETNHDEQISFWD